MRAIVSDLQHAVFQADDERLVAVANIVRVDNKKKKKPTFLCLVGMSFILSAVVFRYLWKMIVAIFNMARDTKLMSTEREKMLV